MEADSPIVRRGLSAQTRQALLTALLLGIAAAALRFLRLGTWSMWADEVATLRDAQNLASVKGYPIGYALIGWFVRIFGDGEFAARFVPALVGTLSPPALYLAGRRLFNERAGVVAGVLLAVSSYHIFFSQFARYYTLVMLLGFGAMWFGYLAIEHNRPRCAALSLLLLAAAALTHWSALLLAPTLALFALLRLRGGLSWRRNGTILAILFGPIIFGLLAASPTLVRFAAHWMEGKSFSMMRFGLIWIKLADRIDAPILLCALVGWWMLWRLRDSRLAWLGSFAAAPVALTAMFVGFSEGGSRFALVALPPFLLMAGYLLDQFFEMTRNRARATAWLLLAVTLAGAGVRDVFYFSAERGQRPRWKEATAYVISQGGPRARVMAAAPQVYDYCARRLGSDSRAEPLSLPSEGSASSSQGSLAAAHEPAAEPPFYIITEQVANMAPNKEQQRWLDEHAVIEKRFPLSVRTLDYSVLVYRAAASPTTGLTTDEH